MCSYGDNTVISLWWSFSSDHLQCGWHFNQGLQCLHVAIRFGGLPGEDKWLSSSKLVSIGWEDLNKRISLPRFHGLRDLVRIFSLYPACLSCLPFVGEPLPQGRSLLSTCPVHWALHSSPCKLVLIHSMTAVPIFSMLHSRKSMLMTSASARLAYPLVPCFFKIGG